MSPTVQVEPRSADRGDASIIPLYTRATPNGHRAAIMLEETGVYRPQVVDLGLHALRRQRAKSPIWQRL